MACPLYAKIDLTTGKVSDFPISHEYFSKYIGGKCLGARLILDLTRPGLDPLDPEAVFIAVSYTHLHSEELLLKLTG